MHEEPEFTEVETRRNELSRLVNIAKGRPADYPWTPQEVLDFETAVDAKARADEREKIGDAIEEYAISQAPDLREAKLLGDCEKLARNGGSGDD